MEFDQSYAGAADWNFPSPTATPTTASFGNVLHTPKTTAFPSHFQDAFATPQMPTYGTPQEPQYQSMTPVQRQQSSSETLRNNYYAAVQAQANVGSQGFHGHPHGTPVVPTNANWSGGMVQPSPVHPMAQMQYNPTQMQTPPPTRGTSAKKPQMQSVAFGTPSTIASRRFMTPQQQNVMQQTAPMPQQQTPMQYPLLQFSPDMQQFTNMGPATAPVVTQSRSFWEAQASPVTLGQPIMLEDPFDINLHTQSSAWSPNPAMHMQQSNVQAVSFDTPAMDSFPVQQPHPRPASAAPMLAQNVPIMPQMYPATSASVDPSLLYSSPVRPMIRPVSRTLKARPSMEQVDSQRRDSAAPAAIITPAKAPASKLGSGLRRSNTVGATRPTSSNSAITPSAALSRSNSINQIPRTASPLKRAGKTPLGSISESITTSRMHRASVVLTVDENGRARAETRNPEATSPTKAARERYPGLYDSDSSDEESDASEEPASRNASFSFTRGEERKSKVAKLDPPIERFEGLTLPRSNSSASMRVTPSRAAVAAASQLKRQGSLRKSASLRTRRSLVPSRSQSSMIDTCPMEFGDTSSIGVESTPSLSPEDTGSFPTSTTQPLFGSMESLHPAQNAVEAHNRRWSVMSFDQQQHQHTPHPQAIRVRCPCSDSALGGGPLVQCKSCTQYQHTACVGVDPVFGQPPSYTCFLCTKPSRSISVRKVRA